MTAAGRPAAIVTGAAGGIGRAIVERLAGDGFDVLAVDRAGPDGHGRQAGACLGVDLCTREGNEAAIRRALELFGRLDVIVAGAGAQHVAGVADFPEDRWDALIASMLTSPFLLAKHAWPALVRSPRARVILMASVHGLVASPYKSAYVAAKHGVVGLAKALALEGAEHEIMVTAVCPGFVRTPLVDAQVADQARVHGMPQERVVEEVILAPHAVKRLIEPEEVAQVVAFLAGPGGSTLTGSPVIMDLGWTAR